MGQSRRTFTREFKLDAVKLITQGGHRISDVAQDLGIGANLLARWKGQCLADTANAFPGKGHLPPDQEELVRLRKENVRLKQELEFLKKTAAYFARQNKSGTL